jgi:hypothetical protein
LLLLASLVERRRSSATQIIHVACNARSLGGYANSRTLLEVAKDHPIRLPPTQKTVFPVQSHRELMLNRSKERSVRAVILFLHGSPFDR